MVQHNLDDITSAKGAHRKPTLKQRTFVKEYISNGGNATKAAMAVYNVKDSKVAQAVGSENLTKPVVLALLNDNEAAAEAVVIEVMGNKRELAQNRLAAAKLLLAYTRGNPVSRNENINVSITLEDILAS